MTLPYLGHIDMTLPYPGHIDMTLPDLGHIDMTLSYIMYMGDDIITLIGRNMLTFDVIITFQQIIFVFKTGKNIGEMFQ